MFLINAIPPTPVSFATNNTDGYEFSEESVVHYSINMDVNSFRLFNNVEYSA